MQLFFVSVACLAFSDSTTFSILCIYVSLWMESWYSFCWSCSSWILQCKGMCLLFILSFIWYVTTKPQHTVSCRAYFLFRSGQVQLLCYYFLLQVYLLPYFYISRCFYLVGCSYCFISIPTPTVSTSPISSIDHLLQQLYHQLLPLCPSDSVAVLHSTAMSLTASILPTPPAHSTTTFCTWAL